MVLLVITQTSHYIYFMLIYYSQPLWLYRLANEKHLTPFLLLLLSIGLLSSCGGGESKTTNKGEDFKTLDTAIFFNGFWVNEHYLLEIKKSKSARKAQGADESCITIPERTLQTTQMIWGFHDGGEDLLVLKNGNQYELWDAGLKHKLQNIELVSNERIKIDNKYFIKIELENNSPWNANPPILEEILFKGKYRLENGNEVEWKANGQISGMDPYMYYSGIVDFSDPGLNIDQLKLGESKDKMELFAYTFHQDTLLIYETNCTNYDSLNHMCTRVEYGKLRLKLLKTE